MKDFLLKTAKLNRSIISDDFEKTLNIINKRIPLKILKYKTGKKCFDWVIPQKWVINDAYIKDEAGNTVLDWKKNPLHVVIGSLPVKKRISKKELLNKIYVSEYYPDLIPYQFKFYELGWGFCMSKKQRDNLKGKYFNINIDSKYIDDSLLVGEYTIKGRSKKTIMLLSHIDHPCQVNDGLAGAAVLIKLAESLRQSRPEYTLKFHFLPERIGSIAYLSDNHEKIKEIIGGIFFEMPGTPRFPLVLQYSKFKNSNIDKASKYVIKKNDKKAVFADCFEQVKNDDAFYNSPGIDIPCVSISRSEPLFPEKMFHFPFYHTSGDTLSNFDFKQAEEYLKTLKEIIFVLNRNKKIIKKYVGVPQLSRHKLWINWQKDFKRWQDVDKILYSLDDGKTILDIVEEHNLDFKTTADFLEKLEEKKLIKLELPE